MKWEVHSSPKAVCVEENQCNGEVIIRTNESANGLIE
jgi:hypothetical protein